MKKEKNNMQFYGLEKQDEFAWCLLHNIKNGIFIDIGCHSPYDASNTWIFEKEKKWTGYAFDIIDTSPYTGEFWDWENKRPLTQFTKIDVTSKEFADLLLKLNIKDVDYISLDVDTETSYGHLNLGWLVLPKIINSGISFKVMTLEHEAYSQGELVRKPSRELLLKLGYKLLFADVTHKEGQQFEDWWINPQYFSDDVFNYGGSNLYWKDCIQRIKKYKC